MSDPVDRSAIRLLMVITGLLGLGFVALLVSALNWEPPVALAMMGSAIFGALAASTWWLARGGSRSTTLGTPSSGVRALVDRLEQLEYDRDVIAQLEERLEFTERLLAAQRNPAAIARPEATPR